MATKLCVGEMIGQIKDQGEFWMWLIKESRPILDYGSDPSWTAYKPPPYFCGM